jgi:hypothetical protein
VFALLANTGCPACRKGAQTAAYAALLHMPEGSDQMTPEVRGQEVTTKIE